jgi:hypothetical protein
MSVQKGHRPGVWALGLVLACAISPEWAYSAAEIAGRPLDSWSSVGVRQVWRVSVPLNYVNRTSKWYLVDEYLYTLGTDGRVRAIRATTGEHLWTQALVDPLSRLLPPTPYQIGEVRGVAFTVRNEVLFLDPATGETLYRPESVEGGKPELRPVGPVHLWAGPISSVVAIDDLVFQAAPRRRVRQYSISRDIQLAQVAVDEDIILAPLYVPQRGLIVVTDEDGSLVALEADSKEVVFTVELKARPLGRLVADENSVCVVTHAPRLHLLDLSNGQEQLEGYPKGYLLPAMPVGGPVMTKESIYVALEGDRLQRVGRELKWPNWLATGVKRFLAEWPGRVALQRSDGRIVFVRPETGETLATIEAPGPGFEGLSNPMNDAIILTSVKGEACCLRPVDAAPLAAAGFRPTPASQPAAAPAAEGTAAATPEEAGPKLSPIEALIADPLKSRR